MRRVLPGLWISAVLAVAQQAAPLAGHWEGSLKVPNQPVAVTVDLAQNARGEWMGVMSMPAQGARDIPLSAITVKGNSVHFGMLNAPGAPVFDGKLSGDGKSISGTFSSGPESVPFELKRTGEADIKAPPPSSPLTKEFEGTWEGVLNAGDQQLRLRLKLTRGPEGAAAGTLTSLDQGDVQIPIASVTQKDRTLTLDIRAVGASFTGTLNAAGNQITGTFTQGGSPMPLEFKRAK